jgi:protocatechuate 3,4-dioxygenase beta subunit
MERDDVQVGQLLTRREALALLGVSGAAILSGCTAAEGGGAKPATFLPGCVVRPQQTEGPYFVDEMLNRSDIRSDPVGGAVKAGVSLQLAINISRIAGGACSPIAGAQVDLWHCDGLGVYSDVKDPGFTTVGQKFLRGYQMTDAAGAARFTTIYPGWYPGRTVHIHFKIRTDPTAAWGYEFTSQLYFDDALTDVVHTRTPYAGKGQRTMKNSDDRIYSNGGEQLLLAAKARAKGIRPHSTSGSGGLTGTAMRLPELLLVLVGATSLAAQQPGGAPPRLPDVAVYPLSLSDSANAGLRALAESCVVRLVVRLAAERITAVRRPSLDLVDLRRARPARFAMVGTLGLAAREFSLEWNLVEVDSGDELRTYFIGPSTADVLAGPTAAAPRIATAIRERVAETNR